MWRDTRLRLDSRNRRVLDLACGTGYGSADLAVAAQQVTAVDIAEEAVAYAAENFHRSNLRWARASATALPSRKARSIWLSRSS